MSVQPTLIVKPAAPESLLSIAQREIPNHLPRLVAALCNGEIRDLRDQITEETEVRWVMIDSIDGLEVLRHSCAHLLAQAVKALFPDVQVTIGPVIEHGFYYDFASEHHFTPEDLTAIENKMAELSSEKLTIEKQVVSRQEAIDYFASIGEEYKVEIIKDLPEDEVISVYQQGDFRDLCRGPHLQHTGQIKAFKLTHVAGAYWRGDSKNAMLQRIYGTAFTDKKVLKQHLRMLEEAKRRDHRLVGGPERMQLFFMSEHGVGAFYLKNGRTLLDTMKGYISESNDHFGYEQVDSPLILDAELWKKSGHWEKFGVTNEMFVIEDDTRTYAVRPMNCPCHVEIFKHRLRSYRDLPLRIAEFGKVHRNEVSGALQGLKRVRAFTQDDGHIFCHEEQIRDEVSAVIDQVYRVYEDFGFDDIIVRLSLRPETRVGSDEIWDHAEAVLTDVLESKGILFQFLPGEGAFYGPKIEFSLRDCLGRVWQCGTVQLDFFMPERLGAYYIDADSQKRRPIMIHRAIFGSLERFMAILIEHYDGRLPLWMAPAQVIVANITDDQQDYANEIAETLQAYGVRAEADVRNEKIGLKVREHNMARVPVFIAVGAQEKENRTLAVRHCYGDGGQETFTLENFLTWVRQQPRMDLRQNPEE